MDNPHLRCQRCGAMYRVITAGQARRVLAKFGDPNITPDDYYHCRLCSKDVVTFEPVSVCVAPLSVVLPPIVQR